MPTPEVQDFFSHWSAANAYEPTNLATTPVEVAGQFKRAQPADVAEILETLLTMGRARQQGEKFSG